jgi:hypothetical protein
VGTRGTKNRGATHNPINDAVSIVDDQSGQDGAHESVGEDDNGIHNNETVVLERAQEMMPPSDAPPLTRSGRRV